jgi:hypothetical protein
VSLVIVSQTNKTKIPQKSQRKKDSVIILKIFLIIFVYFLCFFPPFPMALKAGTLRMAMGYLVDLQ